MSVKRAIFVALFNRLADPAAVVDLAIRAEERGWDGFFVWDHISYRPPVREVADPWVTLAAIAARTQRIVLGPLVTPLPRRRTHQLARETVTLDHLSRGRLVLGVGSGSPRGGEFEPSRFGEEGDMRRRAEMLDEGLEQLQAYWAGGFEPQPVQRPRIPIWVAAEWPPRRKPLVRALRYDGLFPVQVPGPGAFGELAAEVRERRGDDRPFELVVTYEPGADLGPWAAAGATWLLAEFGSDPDPDAVRREIDSL